MPLNHFNLASVFGRAVELGSAVVDGLPSSGGNVQRALPALVTVLGLRGVRMACGRLQETLSPGGETTYEERRQAISQADCSPTIISALFMRKPRCESLHEVRRKSRRGRQDPPCTYQHDDLPGGKRAIPGGWRISCRTFVHGTSVSACASYLAGYLGATQPAAEPSRAYPRRRTWPRPRR